MPNVLLSRKEVTRAERRATLPYNVRLALDSIDGRGVKVLRAVPRPSPSTTAAAAAAVASASTATAAPATTVTIQRPPARQNGTRPVPEPPYGLANDQAIRKAVMAVKQPLNDHQIAEVAKRVLMQRGWTKRSVLPGMAWVQGFKKRHPDVQKMFAALAEGKEREADEILVKETLESLSEAVIVRRIETRECRACRKRATGGMVALDERLKQIFAELTGIECKDGAVRPEYVCETCSRHLIQFSDFRGVCLDSERHFAQQEEEVEREKEIAVASVTEEEPEVTADDIEGALQVFAEQMATNEQDGDAVVIVGEDESDDTESETETHTIVNQTTQINTEPAVAIGCEACGLTCRDQLGLIYHTQLHHIIDELTPSCSECMKEFSNTDKLEYHQRKLHGILKCIRCARSVLIGAELEGEAPHLRNLFNSIKNAENYTFQCRECGLTNPRPVKEHEAKCSDPLRICEYCGDSFEAASIGDHKIGCDEAMIFSAEAIEIADDSGAETNRSGGGNVSG